MIVPSGLFFDRCFLTRLLAFFFFSPFDYESVEILFLRNFCLLILRLEVGEILRIERLTVWEFGLPLDTKLGLKMLPLAALGFLEVIRDFKLVGKKPKL